MYSATYIESRFFYSSQNFKFQDPSVRQATQSNTQRPGGMEEFNPFAESNTTQVSLQNSSPSISSHLA